jgi:hypothetical protein
MMSARRGSLSLGSLRSRALGFLRRIAPELAMVCFCPLGEYSVSNARGSFLPARSSFRVLAINFFPCQFRGIRAHFGHQKSQNELYASHSLGYEV